MVALQKISLFSNISTEDLEKVYDCLAPHKRIINRDTFVFRANDPVRNIYIILSGRMHIVDEFFWGNRSIIETMEPYTLFGEAYVLSSTERHLVSVIAAEDSEVLEIDPVRLFEICPSKCDCHMQLMQNTMQLLSKKIVRLTEKLEHIMQRTTRDKVLSYLTQYMHQTQSNHFDIPYSRQQLADYLCVDRSALSHELSKLKEEGVIDYHKNNFKLLIQS